MPRTKDTLGGIVKDIVNVRPISGILRVVRATGDAFADIVGDRIIGGMPERR